ncbi:MAG: acyltransferase [Pseudomonadota bacterium]
MAENSVAPTPALVIQPIEILRALACLMVIYCHLVGRSTIIFQEHWGPHTLVNNFIITPLGIIQDFGFLGVALFFLISGFIVTHTGLNETRWSFLAKRLLRIYPALIIAVGATVLLATQAAAAGWTDGAMGIGYTNALLSAVGLDTGLTGKAVLDVGWTITIELLFYAHLVVFLPLVKIKTDADNTVLHWLVDLSYLHRTGASHPDNARLGSPRQAVCVLSYLRPRHDNLFRLEQKNRLGHGRGIRACCLERVDH